MRKLTLKEKREARQQTRAKAPKAKTSDPFERVVSQINARLGGQGRVFLASDIEEIQFARRSSGIPSIDYITNGGYPRAGLVEIGGEYSSGKTSLALEACATEQRTGGGAIGWVGLEPFSKRYARERGFWLPFSERQYHDISSGQMRMVDSFDQATELEKFRMEQLGITDPYQELSKFLLVQEERGDVALNAALDMLYSNEFALIIIDSLGVAKSTSWIEDKDVEDSSDFPREAKMIGDYTARAVLALNRRYDENNQRSNDGTRTCQTTLIHLNHIVTNVGTMAFAAHKKQSIKGGEGNKHNHHCIIFLSKGEQGREEIGTGDNKRPYVYSQQINAIALKSKLGPAWMQSKFDFYLQDYGPHKQGDFDTAKDVVQLALLAGIIKQSGAWYEYGELKINGRDALDDAVRSDVSLVSELWGAAIYALKR
jgi:recombination protein RecA